MLPLAAPRVLVVYALHLGKREREEDEEHPREDKDREERSERLESYLLNIRKKKNGANIIGRVKHHRGRQRSRHGDGCGEHEPAEQV